MRSEIYTTLVRSEYTYATYYQPPYMISSSEDARVIVYRPRSGSYALVDGDWRPSVHAVTKLSSPARATRGRAAGGTAAERERGEVQNTHPPPIF